MNLRVMLSKTKLRARPAGVGQTAGCQGRRRKKRRVEKVRRVVYDSSHHYQVPCQLPTKGLVNGIVNDNSQDSLMAT